MTDNLPARVAALELLVEQLILDRAKKRARPKAEVRAMMGRVTQAASGRSDMPSEAVGAAADILAAVILRLTAKE
ncbi:hypothetical protein [Azospirillum sp.]|uniref:hypothetical protein n=1 Tax=Azospirillum sp. TaxID=34012 RepID=UPI002D23B586|nr:hypothetical protein [Azospirillum sp.]HYF89007.1 hypothetical protein [Azospirillum sp.]